MISENRMASFRADKGGSPESYCSERLAPPPPKRCRLFVAFVVAVPSLLLSSCSLAPPSIPSVAPVPERYSQSSPAGHSIAQMGWQDFIQDEYLRALISTALEKNRDIHIASARVAQARAAWRIQGAGLYPSLDAIGTGTRARSLIELPGTGPLRYDVEQITAQVSAGWEIDFWGRLHNLNEAARNRYLASEEGKRAVATGLIAQVASFYLLEREYAGRLALASRTIATREDALRIMRRRYEVGAGSKLEVTQAQILLAQVQSTFEALEQEWQINRNALAVLVGRPLDIALRPLDLMETQSAIALPAGLPSDLLVQRPDIIAAEYQLRAANADIGAARAAFFPSIRLTGAFGTTSTELDGLFGSGSETWNFTPSITLPLFHGGRLAANLDLARARQVEAVANYERTVQIAFRDVSNALVQREQLAKQIGTTRNALNAQRERARLAQLRFDNGRSAYLEVLDAQRDLFETEQVLVRLQRAYQSAGVGLYSALGGGFPAQTAARMTSQQTGEQPQ